MSLGSDARSKIGMFFSRYKRLQKDREAGLVFRWRGGIGGNGGGLLLALILTLGCFFLAFLGLNVSLYKSSAQSQEYAKITLMDSFKPEMALWVDRHSPFSVRWDPQNDVEFQARVQSALNVTFNGMAKRPLPWQEMPLEQQPIKELRLTDKGEVHFFEEFDVVQQPELRPSALEFEVSLEMSQNLKKRFRKEGVSSSWQGEIPAQAYGSNLRFVVVVDAAGNVVYCSPIKWVAGESVGELENWVRRQKFDPAKRAEIGEITVQMEEK